MRKIENQKSFLKDQSGENFIVLPFNKGEQKNDKKKIRTPFGLISNNFKKNITLRDIMISSINCENKENVSEINQKKGSINMNEKNSKSKTKKSKIFLNDVFDIGIINEIQARETFMLDTILRSAILNR
jgi:hypothetical protein